MRIRPTIGLVGLLVLALAATASSQAPRRQAASAPEQDRPTFQAAVDVVEVTVSVTDRDRNSVRDLTAEDFEVYEDGDVQPLVTFSYVDVPFVPLSAPASQPSFDVATNRMREGGGRTYLLLLDDLHTHPLRTDEVRGIARLFIENNLAANDLAAIAVTSGIEPSQPLTSNRQRLLEAADRFIGRDLIDAPGLSLSTDDPFAEFAVNPLPGFGVLDRAKEIKARKVRQLLRALEISAEWMAGTDSRRKAVILVSQGLDYDTTDLFGDREALSLLDEMRRAASAVTRHDVTLYAIDPRGLPSADPGPIPTRWLVGETPFSAPILRAKLTLRGLAEETGGFAFINSNQFDEALEDVVAQNSAYYLLGYQAPRDAPDDQLHQIRVRVDRRDVEVRARRSYVHAPTPAAEATDVMTQLERLLDSPAPRSGLRLDLATMPLRGADSTAEVVVAVHLVPQAPPDDRAGAAGDDAAVVIEALDEEGTVLAHRQVDVVVPPELRTSSGERGVRVLFRLDLAPGRIRLRAAAIDRRSSARGSVDHELDIPDLWSGALAVSGLAIDALPVRPVPTTLSGAQLTRALPVPPSSGRSFSATDTVAVFAEVYVNGASGRRYVDLSSTVRNTAGNVVFRAREERVFDRAEEMYRVEVPLQGVEPGAYVLTVEAREEEGPPVGRDVAFTVSP